MFEGNAQNTANFLIVFSPLTAPAQVFGTVSHTYRRVFEKLECIRIDDANAGIEIGTGNFRGPISRKILSNIDHPLDPILDPRDFGDDWIIQRYADVLLMHSEALNESGAAPDANTIYGINEVRARAGKDPITLPISKEDLREEIWNERKWELCFEGNYHYFDCIRTGRYLDEINKYINFHRQVV